MTAEDSSSAVKCCSKCGEVKSLDQFHRRADRPNGRASQCAACRNATARTAENQERARARRKKYEAKHRAHRGTRRRNNAIRRNYGLSPEDVVLLWASQANSCAACGVDLSGETSKAHIDHDHGTGQVRGILCQPCNMALGLLQDSPARVEKLLAYIQRFK